MKRILIPVYTLVISIGLMSEGLAQHKEFDNRLIYCEIYEFLYETDDKIDKNHIVSEPFTYPNAYSNIDKYNPRVYESRVTQTQNNLQLLWGKDGSLFTGILQTLNGYYPYTLNWPELGRHNPSQFDRLNINNLKVIGDDPSLDSLRNFNTNIELLNEIPFQYRGLGLVKTIITRPSNCKAIGIILKPWNGSVAKYLRINVPAPNGEVLIATNNQVSALFSKYANEVSSALGNISTRVLMESMSDVDKERVEEAVNWIIENELNDRIEELVKKRVQAAVQEELNRRGN